MEQYEIDFLEKYDRGEKFSEGELKEFVFELLEWAGEKEGEEHRWYRKVQTIVKVGERYFSILWNRGLTELQENEFPYQPKEVIKKTYEKTIEVTEWVKVEV